MRTRHTAAYLASRIDVTAPSDAACHARAARLSAAILATIAFRNSAARHYPTDIVAHAFPRPYRDANGTLHTAF
jgi:hypothetical protein